MIKDITTQSDSNDSNPLPEAVTHVRLGKKEIYLIGTAHLSQRSVDDVRRVIELVKPDSICVELCPSRYKAMIEKDTWKTMDIFQVIRKGKALLLLAQLIMSSFYQKLGDQLGIQPGAEMLEALVIAKQTGAKILLADRPIEITLKRIWRSLSFFSKMKMLTQITTGIFELEEIDDALIEEMKQSAQLEDMMEVFAKSFPEIKKRLIDERDAYLAHNIKMAEGEKIVAVVGAGHVKGIMAQFSKDCTIADLEEIPPPGIWGKVFKWSIPLMIISYPVIGFLQGFQQESLDSISIWFATHWISAGFATALAFGHPFTIFVAAFISPFSSLNPLMTAGWFAGLAQAWIKKPTVSDLENVPMAIKTASGFWKNPATRILLVVLLSNIGSMIGTVLSGTWIISRLV
jgi:pheromone shutdown-related protein TraB